MKRHPFDAISFAFGAIFTIFGLTFLFVEEPWDLVFDSANFGWVLPVIVVAGGAALLVSALRPEAKAITDSPLTIHDAAENEEDPAGGADAVIPPPDDPESEPSD